jgi:carbamoyltransferase
LLYSAVTYYTGFKVNSGEYKVMGLAPYGEPRYAATILDHIRDLKSDGSFRLDQSYFNYCTGLTMTSAKFAALFGEPVRAAEDRLTQFHMDMAASVQKVTEEVMLRLTRSLQAESGASNLCLTGGVALNCVANGKVLRDGKFKNIWVQPAAGDAGGALGAALSAYHGFLDRPRRPWRQAADGMLGAYLGPAFRQEEINRRLVEVGACFDTVDQTTMLSALPRTWQMAAPSAGSKAGWNSVLALLVRAQSSAMPARRRCRRPSTCASSIANRSAHSRRPY